jgi:hypothetical protein
VMRLRGDETVSSLAPVVESDASAEASIAAAATAADEAGIEPVAEPQYDEDGFATASSDDD